jgi:adhesin transport system membrane fusion protein
MSLPEETTQFRRSGGLLWLMAAGFVGFVIWAASFEIDQSVRTTGQVISIARTQIIQTADGGVLSDLAVQEGQTVKAGQLLAKLEKERAMAGYEEGRAKVASIRAGLARTKAEIEGGSPQFGRDFNAFPNFVRAQMGLFDQRKRALDEELQVLNQSLEMAEKELAMNANLLKTGDASEIDVLRAKRQVADVQGRIVATRNKYLQEARAETLRLEEELASQSHKLSERQSVLAHTDIIAPMDGIVKFLRITTMGGVLRAGEELMQIAPAGDDLIIEGKVTPADIGQLKQGQPANVKIDAFDYSIYGTLDGQLVHISPDTLSEQGPQGQTTTYYRVHVKVLSQQSNPKAPRIDVRPGMTAGLDIQTGQRTLLNYLLKPVIKSFSGALTEK